MLPRCRAGYRRSGFVPVRRASCRQFHAVMGDVPPKLLGLSPLRRSWQKHWVGIVDVKKDLLAEVQSRKLAQRAALIRDRDMAHALAGLLAHAGSHHLVVAP